MKKQNVDNKKKQNDSKKAGLVAGAKINKAIKKEKPVSKVEKPIKPAKKEKLVAQVEKPTKPVKKEKLVAQVEKPIKTIKKDKLVAQVEKPVEKVIKLNKKQNKKVGSTELTNTKPVKENIKINKEPTEKSKILQKKSKVQQLKRKNEAEPEIVKKLKNTEAKATLMKKKVKKPIIEARVTKEDKKLKSNAEQIVQTDKKSKVIVNKVKKYAEEGKKISKKSKQDKKSKKVINGVKIEVDGEEKVVNDLEIDENHVLQAVDGVLQLAEQEKSDKKLFSSDDTPIFLQVNCIKIPRVPYHRLRIYLPHDMVGPTDDVALFVGDLEKGRRKDYEKTIEHWQNILQEKGVNRIREIIPMAKVKAEYRQFEMKRKLSKLFDFYLVDGKIAGHLTHLLGSTFTRGANPPTPVRLWRDNLKGEFDHALKKTCMEIHGHGGTHCVRIGTVAMPKNQIAENILAACKVLEKEYPGGFDNIRSMTIKTRRSLAIPVYYSMKNKDDVAVPVVKPKRPKAYKDVVGGLSTLDSDAEEDVQISLTPRGDVKILNPKVAKKFYEENYPVKKLKKLKNKTTFKAKTTKTVQKKVLEKKTMKKVK
ncbi:GSCOCG00000390001-RA-CDS [Cotesia congregata]|uniref:Similar to CG13096: Ribosomal L1 domain-containing protein CG13096 (Drosophila melanogaster) n=1 Tax=Cotesia congregata TaxID=51543 RepID=A0A8J2MJQ8_COTCN|nr:GSCOCG00000390001-RA-CDS [Cotesia congregata]CAG5088151.1 Similar to CG13096: Ribosomal L1 domain-containing protein CG13096 (Drosophila melanogaster) [Cotesia congregata]